ALAGLVIAVASGIPQLALLVWMLGSGVLAVIFYRRRQFIHLTAGMGARLGAVAGLVGFAIFGILFLVQALALRGTGQLQAALQEALKQSAARSSDPNAQQLIQRFLTPEGIATL